MDRPFHETRILTINLSSGKTTVETRPGLTCRFVGGRGVNQAILLKKGVDRDEKGIPRRIVIGVGSMVGTDAPCAARTSIDSGNLFNPGIGSGNIGGKVGAYLKFNGYDHLVLEGRAETPQYLYIDGDTAALKDASHLWGKTVIETDALMRQAHGGSIATLYIGPAGENLAKTACIVTDKYRVQGRCGLGVIFGAMRLKGVVVAKKKGEILLGAPDRFNRVVGEMDAKIDALIEVFQGMAETGLSAKGDLWLEIAMPVRNFLDEYLSPEKQKILSPEAYGSLSNRRSAESCYRCNIKCDAFMKVSGAGTSEWAGVEGNAVWDFGSKLDIMDPAGTVNLSALCNDLGLDTDSASGAIAWAFESYEKGILTKEDTGGLELTWGNLKATDKLLRQMACREGIGDLLADGAKDAAEKTGRGSEAWAVHVKGQDLAEPIRVDKAWALGCIVSPRGGTHTRGAPIPFATPFKGETYNPASYDYVDRIDRVIRCERMHAILDALGLCNIPSQWLGEILPGVEDYGRLFAAAMGTDLSDEEIHNISEDIVVIEKIYNQIHAGFDRKDDYPPPRLMEEPVKTGPFKGERLARGDWDRMLDQYYTGHGWDEATGTVPPKTVERIMSTIDGAFESV